MFIGTGLIASECPKPSTLCHGPCREGLPKTLKSTSRHFVLVKCSTSVIVPSFSHHYVIQYKTFIMNLPSELILESLWYLRNVDLKSARLVCKLWSGCASEHLFAKLFISPHELNLQIFAAVAQDPMLSRYVKKVEYDAIHFSSQVTISQYLEVLWRQTPEVTSAAEDDSEHPDPEISQFITICRGLSELRDVSEAHSPGTQDMLAEAWMQCCDFAFVQEGYRKWMDQAAYEKKCSEGNDLLEQLVYGIKQFGRLETVKMSNEWSSEGNLGRLGSPLARSWLPFHAHPGSWAFNASQPLKQSRACQAFWTLPFALSKAGKIRVPTLSIESSLPVAAFIVTVGGEKTHMDYGIAAYGRLENLRLTLAEFPNERMIRIFENLPELHRMLESMTVLKRFHLDLPHDYGHEPKVFFTYAMAFPENGYWPQLTTFAVRNLAIGTKDLITLLNTKMPSLRYLAFSNMHLLDGQWEGIIEYLRVAKRLSTFKIVGSLLLYHGNRNYLLERFNADRAAFLYSIGKYVVKWYWPRLRHPSVFGRQPAQVSLDYLHEVFRLCEMDDIGITIDELVKHTLNEIARSASGKSTRCEETPLEICLYVSES